MQTLRSLNDGCVPISILVGFGKVGTVTAALTATLKTMKELASTSPNREEAVEKNSKDAETENKETTAAAGAGAGETSSSVSSTCGNEKAVDDIAVDSDDITSIAMQIVRTVATRYSVLLDTFKIDTETGKKIGDVDIDDRQQQRQRRWRWAVGTVSGHPIPMEKIESYVPALAPPAAVEYVPVTAAYVTAPPTATTPPYPPGDNNIAAAVAASAAGDMSCTSTGSNTTATASNISPSYHHHQNNHQIANTIILRDVPAIDSNESTIRKLFKDMEQPQKSKGVGGDASPSSSCPSFPAIIDAHLDVHDCWYVEPKFCRLQEILDNVQIREAHPIVFFLFLSFQSSSFFAVTCKLLICRISPKVRNVRYDITRCHGRHFVKIEEEEVPVIWNSNPGTDKVHCCAKSQYIPTCPAAEVLEDEERNGQEQQG